MGFERLAFANMESFLKSILEYIYFRMLITIPEGSAPLGDEENPTRRELDIEIVTTLFDNVWDFLRIDSVVKHSLISNSRSLFDPAYMLFLFGAILLLG